MFQKIYRDALFRFLLIGSLGVTINLPIFYLLADLAHLNPFLAAIIAFMVAVSQNYVLNHHWSFRKVIDYPPSLRAFLKYLAVNIVGLLVNLAVLKIVIDLFSPRPRVIAQFIGIACGTMANYLGSKRFVFQRKNV